MHKRHLYCCISICIFFLLKMAEADVSLRVFAKDEGLYNNEISKPRFYIQNFGTEPLSNFYCYYYFSTESNKIPQVEDYYTPDASISLENMGSGNYRVKFLFSGITINPGQTLPNPDGEVIGLHYTDWSAWDKTNDYSNTRTVSFSLNGNIPVYSSSGVLIYGNDLGIPEIPPQPPQVNTETANYAILSSEFTDLRDGSEVKGGDAGSNVYLEAGCDAVVRGSLFSGGNMFLRERAHIYNDVDAIKEIREQNGIIVEGSKRSNAQLQIPTVRTVTVTPGIKDTNILKNSICTLAPGNYRDVQVFDHATITLMPGKYVFNQFRIEPHVNIILKASNNQRINIQAAGEVRFADSTIMLFEGDTAFPYSINIETAQIGQFFVGNDCKIYGSITAPNAEVHVYSRTQFYGTIFGKKVVVERGSIVCKPPVLLDIWHSEWAYSPPFTSSIFDYEAVVPDITSTLILKPVASSGTIISINGIFSDTISLSGNETDVAIRLNNPDQCGATTYNVNVKKASNYQIFVNDDSPCSETNEDGLSWGTAFKNLQKGIDKATQEGKEIWVAEGVYKPTYRTDSLDSRSATFMIYAGIQIIGGFKGTEANGEPQGSIYKTVLSGDLFGNDDSISTWPPAEADTQYLRDNAYHVVNMSENFNTLSMILERVTINGGVANGSGKNSTGAGVMNISNMPTLSFVVISKNVADSSGAGFFDAGGAKLLKNCLVQSNISKNGCAAGIYTENGYSEIEASVFENNKLLNTDSLTGGAALYSNKKTIKIVNCIFTSNSSYSHGGSIYNKNSDIKIINCSFFQNTALKNGQSIYNAATSKTKIINSIIWNNNPKAELDGSGFTVSYSCIKGGYTGAGNISNAPNFVNQSDPKGSDNFYGTNDDGFCLSSSSPCISTADTTWAPDQDILLRNRPAGSGIEMGAYEYLEAHKCNSVIFGRLKNGEFIENDSLFIVDSIIHTNEIYHYSGSRHSRVLRAFVEKNKYTEKKNTIYGFIQPILNDGTPVHDEVKIELTKIGEENGLLVFQSLKPDYSWGKKFVFVAQKYWHNVENPFAYTIYVTDYPKIQYRIPHSQF